MTSTTPLVSIVIATYNRADVLDEAIDSALNQWYPNVEVIVVDDGSTDRTQELLRAYGDRIVVVRQANRGYGAARNAGQRFARGKYVAWLDSDDVCRPEMTALQVGVLEAHDDVVLVSTDFQGFDARGPRRESVRSYYSALGRVPGGVEGIYGASEILDLGPVAWLGTRRCPPVRVRRGHVLHHLLSGSFVHPPTVMMRRSAAVQAGELDETLRTSIEYPFLFRLARLGPFAFIDHPLLRYRISGDQLSGEAHSDSMALTILKILESLPAREPDVVGANPALYRRRLATAHLNVARVLAERDRPRALRSSWHALRGGLVGSMLIRAWMRMLLPPAAVDGVRRLKRLRAAAR